MSKPRGSTRAKILDFLIAYKRDNGGNNPSYREIMEGANINSTSQVSYHLLYLVARGELHMPLDNEESQIAISRIMIPGSVWLDPDQVQRLKEALPDFLPERADG